MSKRKLPGCSTGHGTGVTPPVDLSRLLRNRTCLFMGRVDLGPLGRVERPASRKRPARKNTKPERVGYFRKKRLALRALIAENTAR